MFTLKLRVHAQQLPQCTTMMSRGNTGHVQKDNSLSKANLLTKQTALPFAKELFF